MRFSPRRKWPHHFWIGLVLVGFGVGCGIRLNRIPGSLRSLQISDAQYGCLSGARDFANQFLDGLASEREVTQFWNCASSAITSFAGQTRDGYFTPIELRNFLQTYFVKVPSNSPEDFIPLGLLSRAMELKVALLGGSADRLTVAELDQARGMINLVLDESLKLRPYLPLNFSKPMYSRSRQDLEEAGKLLVGGFNRLGSYISQTATPYSLDQLDALLLEIQKFGRGDRAVFENVRSQIPSLKAAIEAFGKSDPSTIGPAEWTELLSTAARWYVVFAKLGHSFRAYDSPISGEGRMEMVSALTEATALLSEDLNRRPSQEISFKSLGEFITTYFGKGITVTDDSATGRKVVLSSDTMAKTLEPFFKHLLAGGEKINGINQLALDHFLKALGHWNEGQRYIEALFSSLRMGEATEVTPFSLDLLLAAQPQGSFLPETAGWIASLLKYPELFEGGEREMRIDPERTEIRHSESEISRLHLYREIARLLVYGYAPDRAHAFEPGHGATLDSFKRFYSDFRPLGVELLFLSREDMLAPVKRFREASLFTFAGNGDTVVDSDEAGQLVAFLIAGKNLANRIHGELSHECLKGNPDPYGMFNIETDCYREKFFGDGGRYFDKLPRLKAYFAGLDADKKAEFEWRYEEAGRKWGRSGLWFSTPDSEGFATLALYLEAVFAKYDRSRSGVLTKDDADAAFPVFRNTLLELAQQGHPDRKVSDDDLRDIFRYLLANGTPPGGAIPVLWNDFQLWSHLQTLKADRTQVIKIFATLGKSYGR